MGYLRFSLILPVIYFHLVDNIVAGSVAVYGFFILSGYVITLVSAEIYNNGVKGRLYFLANRIARVWPTYLACLGLSLLAMAATGFTTGFYQIEFMLPESWYGWLVQFSILGQTDFSGERFPERILPPAWSLSTEIFYYLLIGLIAGCNKWLTTIAFGLACAQTAYGFQHGYPFQFYYFSLQGPAPVFFAGGMFYHFRKHLSDLRIASLPLLVLLANLVLYAPEMLGAPRKTVWVLYITSFYLGYIIMCLHLLSQARKPTRADQFLADMTYPLFLLHWPAGALVCYYLMTTGYQRSLEVLAWALPLTLIASAVVVVAVEMPVKRIRRYFRQKAA